MRRLVVMSIVEVELRTGIPGITGMDPFVIVALLDMLLSRTVSIFSSTSLFFCAVEDACWNSYIHSSIHPSVILFDGIKGEEERKKNKQRQARRLR